jgi:hypothetical protein
LKVSYIYIYISDGFDHIKIATLNHPGGGPVVRVWDQEVCFLCGLRFEPCGCSYDGH